MGSGLSSYVDALDLTTEESSQLAHIVMAAAARIRPAELAVDSRQPQLLRSMSLILASALRRGETEVGFSYWYGRVQCIDEGTFADLVAESAARKGTACPMSNHTMAPGGRTAACVLGSAALASFVCHTLELQSSLTPTESFYHYYESPDQWAGFHVDKSDFMVNVLMVLAHKWRLPPTSGFFLVPPGEPPVRMDLGIAEAVVFESSGILHCRSAPAADERVTTVSFGFRKSPK